MAGRLWLLAIPLAFATAAFVGCADGDNAGTTPQPSTDESDLLQTSFAQVIEAAFELRSLPDTEPVVLASDGSTYRSLGRLLGRFSGGDALEMAVFLEHVPAAVATSGNDAGVYVVVVRLGADRRPQFGPLLVVESSRQEILPAEEARAQQLEPFQQETTVEQATVSIMPALATDLEGDGIDELVLIRRTRRGDTESYGYDAYRRRSNTSEWLAVDEAEPTAPGLTALRYWSHIMSGVRLAQRWEPETRLRVVWSWLTVEGATVTTEMLSELVSDGDEERTEADRAVLRNLRVIFQEAHSHLSAGFLERQPWPAFVNGFKATEDVKLVSLSAPTATRESGATIEVLMDLTEREGETPVERRLLVTTSMVEQDGHWLLDDVRATELREPD
jgi:hypothetical protein